MTGEYGILISLVQKGVIEMPGLGTAVNAAGVIVGSLIGMLFGKKIKESVRKSLMRVLGLCVFFVGASGAMAGILSADANGKLSANGTVMMIICLAVGTFIGELLRIEHGLEKFGEWLKKKVGAHNDAGFVNAFVSTSLVVCVGAMAIVGSIKDGLEGDHSTLFAKALLDFLIVMMMSSAMGVGCLFSFIPIVILQGSVTALSGVCERFLNVGNVVSDISLVGSVMIAAVGLNQLLTEKFHVGNMLPALVLAAVYSLCSHYFNFGL